MCVPFFAEHLLIGLVWLLVLPQLPQLPLTDGRETSGKILDKSSDLFSLPLV